MKERRAFRSLPPLPPLPPVVLPVDPVVFPVEPVVLPVDPLALPPATPALPVVLPVDCAAETAVVDSAVAALELTAAAALDGSATFGPAATAEAARALKIN
jgi:hypothetical protein